MALLLIASTATAGELCVNYVSEVHDWRPIEMAFVSFNPRSRESLTIAKINFLPAVVAWHTQFGAVTYKDPAYNTAFKLEWKSGAVPTLLSRTSRWVPSPAKPEQEVENWDYDSPKAVCNGKNGADPPCLTAPDVPNHVEIHFGEAGGCLEPLSFSGPVTWMNTQTGEKKNLYPDVVGQISTADNFMLIAGTEPVVADLNTGEIVLKAGTPEHRSLWAAWGSCPTK